MSLDKYSRFDHGSGVPVEIPPRAVSALGLLYPWLFLFGLVASREGGFEGGVVVTLEEGSAGFAVVEVVDFSNLRKHIQVWFQTTISRIASSFWITSIGISSGSIWLAMMK